MVRSFRNARVFRPRWLCVVRAFDRPLPGILRGGDAPAKRVGREFEFEFEIELSQTGEGACGQIRNLQRIVPFACHMNPAPTGREVEPRVESHEIGHPVTLRYYGSGRPAIKSTGRQRLYGAGAAVSDAAAASEQHHAANGQSPVEYIFARSVHASSSPRLSRRQTAGLLLIPARGIPTHLKRVEIPARVGTEP
jgi:hypothetical protein